MSLLDQGTLERRFRGAWDDYRSTDRAWRRACDLGSDTVIDAAMDRRCAAIGEVTELLQTLRWFRPRNRTTMTRGLPDWCADSVPETLDVLTFRVRIDAETVVWFLLATGPEWAWDGAGLASDPCWRAWREDGQVTACRVESGYDG